MTDRARLYGDSLYLLATEEGVTEEIMEQMGVARTLFAENPDYLRLLSEPSIALSERLGLVDAAFGEDANRYLVNFMKLLLERGYLMDFAGSHDQFVRRYNADHGIAEAVVTSAVALNDAQKKALTEKLSSSSGKKVSLSFRVDPRVLAGIKVEMEGKELDGTAAGHMAGLLRRLESLTL
ncbi:MAG: ATP synthase F1 subunit delta [Blautia sp.]|nr:ATP synthase F1 subunit delta [Blautia sp.]